MSWKMQTQFIVNRWRLRRSKLNGLRCTHRWDTITLRLHGHNWNSIVSCVCVRLASHRQLQMENCNIQLKAIHYNNNKNVKKNACNLCCRRLCRMSDFYCDGISYPPASRLLRSIAIHSCFLCARAAHLPVVCDCIRGSLKCDPFTVQFFDRSDETMARAMNRETRESERDRENEESRAVRRRGEDRPTAVVTWVKCVQLVFCGCETNQRTTKWLSRRNFFFVFFFHFVSRRCLQCNGIRQQCDSFERSLDSRDTYTNICVKCSLVLRCESNSDMKRNNNKMSVRPTKRSPVVEPKEKKTCQHNDLCIPTTQTCVRLTWRGH